MREELEVMWARRAIDTAQGYFRAAPVRAIGVMDVGWHDSTTHPEVGSFAVIRSGGLLDDGETVGEIVRVGAGEREVFAFVIGGADVPTELSLSRPLFIRLALLTTEALSASVDAT